MYNIREINKAEGAFSFRTNESNTRYLVRFTKINNKDEIWAFLFHNIDGSANKNEAISIIRTIREVCRIFTEYKSIKKLLAHVQGAKRTRIFSSLTPDGWSYTISSNEKTNKNVILFQKEETTLSEFCTECGYMNNNFKFCPKCGENLKGE